MTDSLSHAPGTSLDRVRGALQQVDSWPVGAVSAVAITPEGTVTHGDMQRVFSLASISKLITAFAVLLAHQEGAFELDERVPPSLVPQFDTPPTYRELLAHASGIGFRDRVPERPARERRMYSSAGYAVLADALAETTDIPFAEYVREALLNPLGIEVAIEGSAGHGFSASAEALTELAKEFLAPRLLAEPLLAEALTAQFPHLSGIVPGYGRFSPCTWGLGFSLQGDKSRQRGEHGHWIGSTMPADTAGHFGQSGTFLWFHRPTKTAAVLLTDTAFGEWAKHRWDVFNDNLWSAMFAHRR